MHGSSTPPKSLTISNSLEKILQENEVLEVRDQDISLWASTSSACKYPIWFVLYFA